ncbi:MAG: hypothetical protein WDN50_17095 [Bradyrhizobium sp.]
MPYLDDHWKEQVVSRAIDGLDLTSYPPNMPLSGRADWRPGKGKPGKRSGDAPARRRSTSLAPATRICNVLYGAQAVYDPYMAAAFCKAINDWDRGPNGWRTTSGLRASIVVPMQAPDWPLRKSNAAPAITGSFRYWCWRKVRRCSDGGISGR